MPDSSAQFKPVDAFGQQLVNVFVAAGNDLPELARGLNVKVRRLVELVNYPHTQPRKSDLAFLAEKSGADVEELEATAIADRGRLYPEPRTATQLPPPAVLWAPVNQFENIAFMTTAVRIVNQRGIKDSNPFIFPNLETEPLTKFLTGEIMLRHGDSRIVAKTLDYPLNELRDASKTAAIILAFNLLPPDHEFGESPRLEVEPLLLDSGLEFEDMVYATEQVLRLVDVTPGLRNDAVQFLNGLVALSQTSSAADSTSSPRVSTVSTSVAM